MPAGSRICRSDYVTQITPPITAWLPGAVNQPKVADRVRGGICHSYRMYASMSRPREYLLLSKCVVERCIYRTCGCPGTAFNRVCVGVSAEAYLPMETGRSAGANE